MVEAKIKKYDQKELSVSHGKLIKINLGEDSVNFNDIYLRNGSKGYTLYVLGKNGEPAPFTQVLVNCSVEGIQYKS